MRLNTVYDCINTSNSIFQSLYQEGLQSCTVDLSSLHLKYITLQHYLDWMQEIGYPGVMNKSVELLNDVVPTLNTTVSSAWSFTSSKGGRGGGEQREGERKSEGE